MSVTVKNIRATVITALHGIGPVPVTAADIDANLAFVCVSSFLFHPSVRPLVSSSLIMFGCDFIYAFYAFLAFTQWVMFESIMYRPGFALSYSRREAIISSPFSDRGRSLETRGSDIGADSAHANCPRRRPLCGEMFCIVY